MTEQYQTISRQLIAEIESGKYKRGELFPKRNDLATRFGVTRSTIDRSMRVLIKRGLVESTRGAGTFVTFEEPSFRIGVVNNSLQNLASRNDLSKYHLTPIMGQSLTSRTKIAALREFDGILFHFPGRELFDIIAELSQQMPSLVINRHLPQFNFVSVDHSGAIKEITSRRIAENKDALPVFLQSGKDIVSDLRTEGFVSACREANRFYEIVKLPVDFEGKIAVLRERSKEWKVRPMTLVSGELANTGAVMAWVRENGFVWKKDVLYSDFDNDYKLDIWGIKVTSFLQDMEAMQIRGLKCLGDLIRGEVKEVHELIKPEMVIGDT